ncbi:unnamed protein product [Phytophthora lilii]|uniref:Unnamed protein product n=1 Tax=Phytophthora lilii TaxID=2077276 RepID=A0A9W7D8T0_9STRA|nr:unnamed protein product [Phytophthora lilii]
MLLRDAASEYVRDTAPNSMFREVSVFSLALDMYDSCLPQMLGLIGKSIQKLTLRYVGDSHVNLDLSAIAEVCPDITELYLRDFNVVLDIGCEALHAWGLKKLTIEGSREATGLELCLQDNSFRMSRELVELKVLAPQTRTHPTWLRTRSISSRFVGLLKNHDKEFLPVVKDKFPLASKLAMLSVVRNIPGSSIEYLKALHDLDSCIF